MVYNRECPLLASMAEEGWVNNEIARLTIEEYLKAFDGKKIDGLILGCTHYPLFEKLIKEKMPNVEIINTGKILANKFKTNSKNEEENYSVVEDEFYLTDTESNFLDVGEIILDKKIKVINANF